MTKEKLFSTTPSTFVYCTNVNCGRKDSCLRHLALSHAPEYEYLEEQFDWH